MGLGIGNQDWIAYWDLGLELGLRTGDWNLRLQLGMRIGYWEKGLGIGIRIGDWELIGVCVWELRFDIWH